MAVHHFNPVRSRGFTLLELLVVLSIITLLMALLLPSLAASRRSAQAVQCLSNQRQLYGLIRCYVQEEKGWLPYTLDFATQVNTSYTFGNAWSIYDPGKVYYSWTDVYIGSSPDRGIMVCPAATAMGISTSIKANCGNYGLNYHVFRFSNYTKRWNRLDDIRIPGGMLMLTDVWDTNYKPSTGSNSVNQFTLGNGAPNAASFRHDDTLRILWGDGHATPYADDLPNSTGPNTTLIWKGGNSSIP